MLVQELQDTLMSRYSGKGITDEADLVQSIQDILTTPIGTRCCVRDYGSDLPAMVDRPVNRDWIITAYATITKALTKWEPRFLLYTAGIDAGHLSQGIIELTTDGLYKPLGRVIRLENITLNLQNKLTAASIRTVT